jgi:hypothetical protein
MEQDYVSKTYNTIDEPAVFCWSLKHFQVKVKKYIRYSKNKKLTTDYCTCCAAS